MAQFPTYTKIWHQDVYPDIDASRPEFSAKGKRIAISGGGTGIGAAAAEAFAIAGASEIIILGRTAKTLDQSKDSILSKHANTNVVPIVTDLADATSTKEAFEAAGKRGSIDVYINNAAYMPDMSPLRTADVSDWTKSFDVNVTGPIRVMQAILPNISHNGVIINVTSGAAHVPYLPQYSAYSEDCVRQDLRVPTA